MWILGYAVTPSKDCLVCCSLILLIYLFLFVCQNVMEQFNPGLRNLINLGKNYEKAVNGKSVF